MESVTPVSFSLPQRAVHWATALLVFFNLLFTEGMEEWNRAVRRTGSATAEQVASANIHAYVGIAILILLALRIILRFTSGAPAAPPEEPALFRFGAKLVHAALYVLLIAIPLTGIGAYYLGNSQAGEVHAEVLKTLLWIVIAAHVLGALMHQFYWKTNVLRRMTVG
ncbi:cytochrome b/b6 domain-containing protein [Neorhizobium sp. Rsf11]|uniref:Cytochrome b/b6 domain-containing protein n=2 Tax=Neorhizobium TaxID=1525371 RepID=A0ABV0LYM5_9HYPH|nr:cytochrome b/b6 domain-containing protein [Neorhizobium petrolearium]MCC2612366.1 cytochrome b/b6 domain-containing protein [Neorhizobium petrolearium]WGI67502.1 cytochrome b/b6 domain-containing protein [Neorhizobium petrolearium]